MISKTVIIGLSFLALGLVEAKHSHYFDIFHGQHLNPQGSDHQPIKFPEGHPLASVYNEQIENGVPSFQPHPHHLWFLNLINAQNTQSATQENEVTELNDIELPSFQPHSHHLWFLNLINAQNTQGTAQENELPETNVVLEANENGRPSFQHLLWLMHLINQDIVTESVDEPQEYTVQEIKEVPETNAVSETNEVSEEHDVTETVDGPETAAGSEIAYGSETVAESETIGN